ncbi:hypothetical protein [Leptospira inadai]|nr:hypothetical protein [Leptospira inadai]
MNKIALLKKVLPSFSVIGDKKNLLKLFYYAIVIFPILPGLIYLYKNWK